MSRNGFRGVLDRCVVVASSSVKPGALFVKICTRDLHVFGVVWVHEFSFFVSSCEWALPREAHGCIVQFLHAGNSKLTS